MLKQILLTALLAVALIGCAHNDDDDTHGGTGGVVLDDGKPAPVPIEDPLPKPPEVPVTPKRGAYDHYNPAAWHGRGSALVLCSNAPVMDRCEINGHRLTLHGSRDKGRLVYTDYYKSGLGGTIICTRGNDSWAYSVSSRGLQYGSCR